MLLLELLSILGFRVVGGIGSTDTTVMSDTIPRIVRLGLPEANVMLKDPPRSRISIRRVEVNTVMASVTGQAALSDSTPTTSSKIENVRSPRAMAASAVPESAAVASLREENERLRWQVRELQRVSSLGVLAGSVCHELNNALTPILNYAKLGLKSSDVEFRTKSLDKILQAAQRATTITTGMLGLARPNLNQKSSADLARLVEETLMLTAKDLEKHRVELVVNIRSRPQAKVCPPQIQQVLLNLIINARQAMGTQGHGRIVVQVGSDSTGKWAEVAISDSGQGMEPAVLKRIFEPFFTTKPPGDESGLGGTGLGLPVCRDIIEAHQGRLRVESKPGHGATFTVRLPREADQPTAAVPGVKPAKA
jgi:signal transduction histidine kinase